MILHRCASASLLALPPSLKPLTRACSSLALYARQVLSDILSNCVQHQTAALRQLAEMESASLTVATPLSPSAGLFHDRALQQAPH